MHVTLALVGTWTGGDVNVIVAKLRGGQNRKETCPKLMAIS